MRVHQQSTWLYWMTALLAGIGLAVGSTACEPNEGVYEGTEDESAVIQEDQDEEFGVFDEEVEQEQMDQEQMGQEQMGQEQMGQEQMGQEQMGQEQAMGDQQEDIALEDLDPSQISDQDLAQFAELSLELERARQEGREGAVGGGPVEGQDLEEWETEMIQREGMGVDRYLAIRMMLQESPELQQRYEQVLEQIHETPTP